MISSAVPPDILATATAVRVLQWGPLLGQVVKQFVIVPTPTI